METGTTATSADSRVPTQDVRLGMEPSAPAPVAEPDPILAALDRIAAGFDAIKGSIAVGNAYDKAKEEAFDRLYRELDDLRSEREFDRLRPLYLDLILLFDRVDQSIAPALVNDASPAREAVLSSLREELLEVLYRRDIELIELSPTIFDPTVQRAVGAQRTELPDLHNSIASVVRPGFRCRGRLLRAEEVIVNRYGK